MNAKIERVNKEIDKTKKKIYEQQARLRDLEKHKTELENLDIVSTVRGMNISFTDLAQLLKQANINIPGTPATSGQVGPKLDELAASAEAAPITDIDKEENE